MNRISAFTLKSEGIINVIRTPIKVSNSNIKDSESAIETVGIWDTGATECAISTSIVKKLGLVPIGKVKVSTANGEALQNYYVINLALPNNVIINGIKANEIPEIVGAEMLIGMSVMTMGDFSLSNKDGKTIFSFRIPSMCKTDYVELLKSQTPSKIVKIGRNESCPCGSGKKYKKCCGR